MHGASTGRRRFRRHAAAPTPTSPRFPAARRYIMYRMRIKFVGIFSGLTAFMQVGATEDGRRRSISSSAEARARRKKTGKAHHISLAAPAGAHDAAPLSPERRATGVMKTSSISSRRDFQKLQQRYRHRHQHDDDHYHTPSLRMPPEGFAFISHDDCR